MKKLLTILVLLSFCFTAKAAFALVQAVSSTSASASSRVLTVSSTVANNLVVVHVILNSISATVAVTDDKGNTYALAGTANIGAARKCQQYYGVQVTGGMTSITITFGSTVINTCGADEYSGAATTNATAFDKNQSNSTPISGTAVAVTSYSPTATGELIVATVGSNNAVQTYTAGSGYTLSESSTSVAVKGQYKLSGVSSETSPCTLTTSSAWAEISTAYNPASSPPATHDVLFFNGNK